jgi:hypothetical protein
MFKRSVILIDSGVTVLLDAKQCSAVEAKH